MSTNHLSHAALKKGGTDLVIPYITGGKMSEYGFVIVPNTFIMQK